MIAGAAWWATFGLGLVIGALAARLPDVVGWVADRFDQHLDHGPVEVIAPPPPRPTRPDPGLDWDPRVHIRLRRRPFDQDDAA